MMDFGGNYLSNDVLKISMSDFVDGDGPLNEPIHESWLHMQDANKTKALSCVLTVKWQFSHVETENIMAPLLFSTSSCHYKYYRQIRTSALSNPNIIFLSNGLSVISYL